MEISDRQLNICEKTGILPQVVGQIRELAMVHGIRKVILFGSRARGNYRRESDIDLAVSGGDVDLFRLDVEEKTDTLLQYDVINLDMHLKPDICNRIMSEGIVIYEKI